jgi:hypothetical protein
VQVLPLEFAEGPTRESTAQWNPEKAEHAGLSAIIEEVDDDNTVQLRFEDHSLLWYSTASCTKTLTDFGPTSRFFLKIPMPESGLPITRTEDCAIGEHVRALVEQMPIDAHWTDAHPVLRGQRGTILAIEDDKIINVRFGPGQNMRTRCVRLLAQLCTKTGTSMPYGWAATVQGAKGEGACLNGDYQQRGEYNDKPLLEQQFGPGLLFAGADDSWRLGRFEEGWVYKVESKAPLPPETGWEGYARKDALGKPIDLGTPTVVLFEAKDGDSSSSESDEDASAAQAFKEALQLP